MRKIENTKQIAKFICIGFGIYSVCYLLGRLITTVILYRDNIKALMKRVCLKLSCFLKKLHLCKMDKESIKDGLKEAIQNAPVIHMDDLEFACSEE